MNLSPITLAERVVRAADREHPADSLLRQELKAAPDLFPADAAQASRAVFAWFRWQGWLNRQAPLRAQIESALQCAHRFVTQPQSFADADLLVHAMPGWLRAEMQVTPDWVRALQAEPKLWLRARPGQGRSLANQLGDCRPFGSGPLADALQYRGTTDLFRTPEFHAGAFELQDISSQAVGLLCAPEPGQTWWDACAGEGGKTLHLSDLMANKGLIWASDRAAWRLARLKRRAARAKVFNFRSVPWEGGAKLPTKTKFDGVLVDAPCSGVGTWQRNPHARWTTTHQDVQELSQLQLQLLTHAAAAVKPGGKLIYAVCTLTRKETVGVVEAFQQQIAGLEPLALPNPLDPAVLPSAQHFLWPQQHGGNGMFIAVWKRPANSRTQSAPSSNAT